MYSIADVSLKNGIKKRKEWGGEIGRPDEAPSPSKRHRRRKEVNSPRSVLFKSLYRAEKKKREKTRERHVSERAGAKGVAQLNYPWRARGRERSAKDSVIYLWPSRVGEKKKKWEMNRPLMKSHLPICLASFSPETPPSSRNLSNWRVCAKYHSQSLNGPFSDSSWSAFIILRSHQKKKENVYHRR